MPLERSLLRRSRAPGHGGPDEAHQFAGHRRHGDRRSLAVADEMAIAPMQPLLGPPGMTDDERGLAIAPRGQGPAEAGAMPVMPGGFHERAAGMRIARLGDRAAPLGLSRGVLAGHEPQIRHELAGSLEPLEVDDLRHEDHGG